MTCSFVFETHNKESTRPCKFIHPLHTALSHSSMTSITNHLPPSSLELTVTQSGIQSENGGKEISLSSFSSIPANLSCPSLPDSHPPASSSKSIERSSEDWSLPEPYPIDHHNSLLPPRSLSSSSGSGSLIPQIQSQSKSPSLCNQAINDDDLCLSPPKTSKRRKLDESPSSSVSHGSAQSNSSTPSKLPPENVQTAMTCHQIDKVVWVDIGINLDQTYWWPGVITRPRKLSDITNGSDVFVKLLPEPQGKLSRGPPKLLSSFKASKSFEPLPKFVPSEMNPIFLEHKSSSGSVNYPSAKSLSKAYAVACEKHVVYTFQLEDELPDLSACMAPFSQESTSAIQNWSPDHARPESSPQPSSQESTHQPKGDDVDGLEQHLDAPDPELQIPGETVLSREKAKGAYWPARVVGYAGLRRKRWTGRSRVPPVQEKYYELEYCDGKKLKVPRSYFLTADQEDFHTVKIGQLHTTNVTFEGLTPNIEKHVRCLDIIIKGESTNPILRSKHEKFLSSLKGRGEIPRDVRYGKYCEDVIHKVGEYLRAKYINTTDPDSVHSMDQRFSKLTNSEKSQYIYDILVPELIWLITVEDYTSDAADQLPKDSNLQLIWSRAEKLATANIQEVDVVDKVIGLRVRNKSHETQEETPKNQDFGPQGPRTLSRRLRPSRSRLFNPCRSTTSIQ